MRDTCPTPAFTSKSRDSVVSLDCGSPWAVDLTADADCNREGVERCHPRLTLGWQRQEVLLSMPSDPLPTAEYVQAYCDLWRRGRHENVLVAPVEQDEARQCGQSPPLAVPQLGSCASSLDSQPAHRTPSRCLGCSS